MLDVVLIELGRTLTDDDARAVAAVLSRTGPPPCLAAWREEGLGAP
ncbi:MAG: hypothetical protein AB1492_04970 [Bacillota bacterium]